MPPVLTVLVRPGRPSLLEVPLMSLQRIVLFPLNTVMQLPKLQDLSLCSPMVEDLLNIQQKALLPLPPSPVPVTAQRPLEMTPLTPLFPTPITTLGVDRRTKVSLNPSPQSDRKVGRVWPLYLIQLLVLTFTRTFLLATSEV